MTQNFCSAQNLIELLDGADNMTYNESNGSMVITGNVRLKSETSTMYCDRAVYFPKKEIVKAYGKVHIQKKDTLNLFCDSLHYNASQEIGKLWGNVRVRDREFKLETDTLEYDAKKGAGIYRHGGVISSILSDEVLKSRVGYFYPDTKNFFFSGDVEYTSKEYTVTTDTLRFNGYSKKAFFYGPTDIKNAETTMYCESGWYNANTEEGVLQQNAQINRTNEIIKGDSLYYNVKDGIAIGSGNVEIQDTVKKLNFSGGYAYSSEKEHMAFLTKNALAMSYELEDTLFIHADTLFNYLDTTNQVKEIRAYRGVKIYKNDVQGSCDSLSYKKADSVLYLYNNPLIWSDKAQLSGDTMIVYQNKSKIDKIEILNNGLVVTEVDSNTYYNQVTGTDITAFFKQDSIHKVTAIGNAKTIYFIEQEEEQDSIIEVKRTGMSRLYASKMTLYFERQEVTGITYYDEPDGAFYPMDKIVSKEERVTNFKWQPEFRPKHWSTMILD